LFNNLSDKKYEFVIEKQLFDEIFHLKNRSNLKE